MKVFGDVDFRIISISKYTTPFAMNSCFIFSRSALAAASTCIQYITCDISAYMSQYLQRVKHIGRCSLDDSYVYL